MVNMHVCMCKSMDEFMLHYSIASVCNHGDIRLYGGSISYGNIGVAEVCINGK